MTQRQQLQLMVTLLKLLTKGCLGLLEVPRTQALLRWKQVSISAAGVTGRSSSTDSEDEVSELEDEISALQQEINALRVKARTDEAARTELEGKMVELTGLQAQLIQLQTSQT